MPEPDEGGAVEADESYVEAYVWASKEPDHYSFNTASGPLEHAERYALNLIRQGRRLVRVYRADMDGPIVDVGHGPLRNYLTDDLLLELRAYG